MWWRLEKILLHMRLARAGSRAEPFGAEPLSERRNSVVMSIVKHTF